MFKKIPIAGTPIGILDIAKSLSPSDSSQENFKKVLKEFFSSKYLFLCSSGVGAFYLILKVLKCFSDKQEVILPAYTAPALILPIRKLKLKPILCDISLDDFSLDISLLPLCISNKTLCIVNVHLFGIVSSNVENLKREFPDTYIIEDCAQAMGTRFKDRQVGNFTDISFFSFNRGKNLPTYGGGCIVTDNRIISEKIEEEIGKIDKQNLMFNLLIPLKIIALSLAVRPFIYGLGYAFISHFKDLSVHEDFKLKKFTGFQAGLGLALLRKMDEFSHTRYQNGMALIEGLKDVEGIILPKITEDSIPAFNRLPIVFKDIRKKEQMRQKLHEAGIETSDMYKKSLHHIFELGYRKEEFPHAAYLAERLLTLPVHPLVNQDTIERIINILKDL